MISSLKAAVKDEIKYLTSSHGNPYHKMALIVAVFCSVFFTLTLSHNFIQDAPVAVIDLDNSKYSHELIEKINASTYMEVTAVLNTPVDPAALFYKDRCVAVVYLPEGLEKDRYTRGYGSVGVFYDNTNIAQTGDLKGPLNLLIAEESLEVNGASLEDSPGLTLKERNLFNPSGSTGNGEGKAFLFFFSSMFFVFATIGIVPRLRLEHKLDLVLKDGFALEVAARVLPYCCAWLAALMVGLVILRFLNDLVFTGSFGLFLLTQIIYIPTLGVMSILFGWTAANPGVASSRMIFFIPGGFIFGGYTGPMAQYAAWVRIGSHFFPLTWEFEFTRDILMRGAGLTDIAQTLGGFLLYAGVIVVYLHWRFWKSQEELLQVEEA